MRVARLETLVLIAAALGSTGVVAQTVYKCGNAYSQLPCPGTAVEINPDPRTSAQKLQSDLATARDARSAATMEKSRLQQEKADLAANTPPAPAKTNSASKPRKSELNKKKKRDADSLAQRTPPAKKQTAVKPGAKASSPS
jgi:predicted flavoprotein YhiN